MDRVGDRNLISAVAGCRFHVAGDGKEDVVGLIARAVIADDVFPGEFVVDVRVADDGVAIGTFEPMPKPK